jgi:trehalose 6-phosphate phosphatase
VLVTDFDGTLAPIVDDPAEARPLVGVPEVLARLIRSFAVVAVVSGRPASFLWDRLGRVAGGQGAVDHLHLIGLYGMESAGPDGTVVPDEAVGPWRTVVQEAASLLRTDAPAGVLVEVKGSAVTVHWRRARGAEGWAGQRVAEVARRTGLEAHLGRLSLELRPPLAIDKGTAVRRLAQGSRAVSFFGDDLGDLPAFAEIARQRDDHGLTAVGVAVIDEETAPEVEAAADLSVRGPEGALAVLEWLADRAPASQTR